ncbi:hypothetical protein [Leifsonia aquatica]|uniref:hypothetical protein n=1 Tax=Leifsonia aquatica TaxID=144185 RepID=UPI00046AB0D6|nr:hypothetical protein [Leifsonia aquatica]
MTDEHVDATPTLVDTVARVPGVTRLYPAGTLIGRMAGADDVDVGADRIRIRIGVVADDSAAEVCRRVYSVARDWARAAGMANAIIEITAAGIETQ